MVRKKEHQATKLVQLPSRILFGSGSQKHLELHGNRDLPASSLGLRSGCVLLDRKPSPVGNPLRCVLNASTDSSSGEETLHVACVQHFGDLQRVCRPYYWLLDPGLDWDKHISGDKRLIGRVDHSFDPRYHHSQWCLLHLFIVQGCLRLHHGLLHQMEAQETWQKEEEGPWLKKVERVHWDSDQSSEPLKSGSQKHWETWNSSGD